MLTSCKTVVLFAQDGIRPSKTCAVKILYRCVNFVCENSWFLRLRRYSQMKRLIFTNEVTIQSEKSTTNFGTDQMGHLVARSTRATPKLPMKSHMLVTNSTDFKRN